MSNLQPYQKQVIVEKAELSLKISKLSSFIDTVRFFHLSNEEQDILLEQCDLMRKYSDVLGRRIEGF